MPTNSVVIAGVSSGLGLHLARAILSAGHRLTLFSRTPQPALESAGAVVVSPDYSSPASLISALTTAGAHTVICTFYSLPLTFALADASLAAGVKRFVPSEFALTEQGNHYIELYKNFKVPIWEKLQAQTQMEYAAFRCGVFMNYLAHGSPAPGDAFEGLGAFSYVVDVASGKAVVPGTGDEVNTFTRLQDVATFVAAAVALPDGEWRGREDMDIAGDKLTWNQVIKLAEKATGKKFDVTYQSKEELEKELEVMEGMEKFYTQAKLAGTIGLGEVDGVLNERFPEIKPVKMEEFLETWWGAAARGE